MAGRHKENDRSDDEDRKNKKNSDRRDNKHRNRRSSSPDSEDKERARKLIRRLRTENDQRRKREPRSSRSSPSRAGKTESSKAHRYDGRDDNLPTRNRSPSPPHRHGRSIRKKEDRHDRHRSRSRRRTRDDRFHSYDNASYESRSNHYDRSSSRHPRDCSCHDCRRRVAHDDDRRSHDHDRRHRRKHSRDRKDERPAPRRDERNDDYDSDRNRGKYRAPRRRSRDSSSSSRFRSASSRKVRDCSRSSAANPLRARQQSLNDTARRLDAGVRDGRPSTLPRPLIRIPDLPPAPTNHSTQGLEAAEPATTSPQGALPSLAEIHNIPQSQQGALTNPPLPQLSTWAVPPALPEWHNSPRRVIVVGRDAPSQQRDLQDLQQRQIHQSGRRSIPQNTRWAPFNVTNPRKPHGAPATRPQQAEPTAAEQDRRDQELQRRWQEQKALAPAANSKPDKGKQALRPAQYTQPPPPTRTPALADTDLRTLEIWLERQAANPRNADLEAELQRLAEETAAAELARMRILSSPTPRDAAVEEEFDEEDEEE